MNSVVIIGGGESGVGAALLARKNGLEVFVSDYGKLSDKYKKELQENRIPFEEEGHELEKLVQYDFTVKSPGISDQTAVIKHLQSAGIEIMSEVEFASRYYNGKIIAVTGSNGKTTTASLIYHLLREAKLSVGLGGNIGYAFSRLMIEDEKYDYLVLELSSFQLDDVREFRSDISVILNITADHLDRYDNDIRKYGSAKWRLAQCTRSNGFLITNHDDELIQEFIEKEKINAEIIQISSVSPIDSLSKDDGSLFEIKLLGRHNLYNAAVSKEVARLCGLEDVIIASGLLSFVALEHRLELVTTIENIDFINDSKATNVDAVEYALEAIDKPIVWIAGGTDKGNDYSGMLDVVSKKVKSIICLCVDDSKLRSCFSDIISDITTTQSMNVAVRTAYEKSNAGDVVLLSPACASFDLFDNYIDRGLQYKKEIFDLEK